MATDRVQFWPDDAPVIGECPCGGDLMLVEDPGPKRPVEAQCSSCGEPVGLAHELVVTTTAPSTGAADQMPF